MGTCRLCLQEKELIKTSHIIPKFMYKGILEKNKRIVETNLFNPSDAIFRPTGSYESGILCKACDNNVIGKLESYAAKILFQNQSLTFRSEEDKYIKNLMLKDIDYTKFKLFLISLLWRASISTQKLFGAISLGSKHEESARKMIFENEPGRRDEFPTCIMGLETTVNLALRTIVSPRKLTSNGNTQYMFWVNGFFYWYNISSYNMDDVFNRTPITENNEMTIGILKGRFAEEFFDEFVGKKVRFRKPY